MYVILGCAFEGWCRQRQCLYLYALGQRQEGQASDKDKELRQPRRLIERQRSELLRSTFRAWQEPLDQGHRRRI